MAAKFCSNCGGGLGPADRFCPLCGTKVISACPTCGQAWDGVTIAETAEAKSDIPAQKFPVTNKMKRVNKEIDDLAVVAASSPGNTPIYGSAYDPMKDCANCGKPGKKQECDSCGSGVNK